MDAGIEFLQKLGVADPMEEYRRKHQMRRVPVRLDENQATGVPMSFHQYYRSEFKEFLNVLIVQYGENLTRCFETLKTPLRTTMGDQRLESLLLMSCEKDFTDSIDFECVARDWADFKTRRINCPQS